MPYLIRVIFGKEKKVAKLFAREGVELTRIPVSEYLIGTDPRCEMLRYRDTIKGYIINVSSISDEEAARLYTQETEAVPAEESVAVGNIVTITDGPYKGQNGVLRKIAEGQVSVDICLFGRMHPLNFAREQVRLSKMPEVWK